MFQDITTAHTNELSVFDPALQVVKLLEKEPENALQPNMVTSSSVTSSTQMTSASEETTVQRAAEGDGEGGVKKTVTVQQETTQRVTTSTSEQVNKDKDATYWVTLGICYKLLLTLFLLLRILPESAWEGRN